MSSNDNDEFKGVILVVGLIGAMAYLAVIAIGLIAIAAFTVLTILFTIFSMLAWNRPMRIGKDVLTPDEARGFIRRGIIGAFVLPFLLAVLDLFTRVPVNWDYLPLFMFAGYGLGSLVLALLFSSGGDEPFFEYVDTDYLPPRQQSLPAPVTEPTPKPVPEPFRYASWDDEEETLH